MDLLTHLLIELRAREERPFIRYGDGWTQKDSEVRASRCTEKSRGVRLTIAAT